MKKFDPVNLVLGLIVVVLLVRTCTQQPEVQVVTVPPIHDTLEVQKPVYVERVDTVYRTFWKTHTDTLEIVSTNPVNDSLAIKYQQLTDSLDRYRLFLEAIEIKEFSNRFEDEFLDLTIEGQVQGQLNYIRPIYTIKERKIEVPYKARFYAGPYFSNNNLGAAVFYSRRPKELIGFGYGLDNSVFISYSFGLGKQ